MKTKQFHKPHLRAAWCAFTAVLFTLAGSHSATAFTNTDADTIFNYFNREYYQPFGDGLAHFKNDQTGGVSYFWTQAQMIETFEDAYDRKPNAQWQGNISSLLNGFSSDNGTNWSNNPFNDDVTWACLAYLRGFQITGNTTFRDIARNNFDMMYARAWDTVNGGLWWDVPKGGKNTVNNCPAIIAAYKIYQIYGDSSYLTKAQNIYNWQKTHLYDPNSGATWANVFKDGTMNFANNIANQGLFVGAADLLGDTANATKAMDYAKNVLCGAGGGVMPAPAPEDTHGIRYMVKYMTNRNLQSTYLTWLQFNANMVWANRRASSDNLCWQNWAAPTQSGNLASYQTFTAVEALQVVPADNVVINVYRFTSIGNAGQCLQGTSDMYLNAGGAQVAEVNEVATTPTSWNLAEQEWTLLPCGSGTCYIRNNKTGQFLQSTGDAYHAHGGGNVTGCNKLAATPPWHNNQQIWSLPASGGGINIFNPTNNQHIRATGDGYWSNTNQAFVGGCNQSALVPHAGVTSQDQWNLAFLRAL